MDKSISIRTWDRGKFCHVLEFVCPQCSTVCEQGHRFCHVCGFPIADYAPRSEDPLIGMTLPGGYVILDLVGVGGMGRVYRAEQKALGRTVAVKIIHPHLVGDESTSVRFITEARAASRLNHPNSVGVIDFGKNDNQLYLVMEFLRGRDLARVDYEDGPLPFSRIADILCQVLAALAEAHHLGIIHRDLKPENIVLETMRSGGDFVKVVDFGLAKMREVTGTHITSPGIVCGTPDYMSPEQGRGDPIDARSDLYACGVILFQLLTGRLPFEAESPTQVVLMHLSVPPPNPADVAPQRNIPPSLVAVTMQALEKEASRRYGTADDFAAALRTAMDGVHKRSEPVVVDGAVLCPSCRASVPRGQKFCGECGGRIHADPLSPTIQAPRVPAVVDSGRDRRTPAGPTLPLPFTARQGDLEWLGACRFEVEATVSAARIIGEPGIGKTRLLGEFLRGAAELGDVVVQTGPDPWWADVSYYALRKAIINLAGLPRDGGDAHDWNEATPEARGGLAEIFGKGERPPQQPGSNMWSKPVPGILRPEDRRFIVAEALRWAMGRAHHAADGHLLILAIDDLQAVDGASRNAFADVIAEPPFLAMLVVATHAPGFDPGWGGASRTLGGLPTGVAASLLKGNDVRRSSSGIENRTVLPLYIDQLVRFSREGGSDPPPRLADIIALRIERLPPEARRTLQSLAVLGDATPRSSLKLLVQDATSFEEQLATLMVAGMIEEAPSGIRTTHPLIREVTLASIPVGVRRELHSRAPYGQDDEPLPLPLEVRALHAYHSQSAFEALMLLEQTADRAATRGDCDGSVLALRRGLDLARREIFRGEIDDPMNAVLIFSRKLGEELARGGNLSDADGVLREALDLAGPSGPDRARVLGSLAFVARERDRMKEATVYLREALELAKQSAANDLVVSLERLRHDWMSG